MANAYDPEQLSEAENTASQNAGTSTSGGEIHYTDETPESERSLYNSSSTKPGRLRFKSWSIRKKAAVGGGIASAGVIGVLAFSTFFSGPLQFIHFAQLLQKFHFSNNEDMGDSRSARMIIYTLMGQGNRSRLGIVTNKYVDRWEDRIVRKTGLRPVFTAGINSRFAGFKVENERLARDYLREFEGEGTNTRASPTDIADRKGNRLNPGDRFVSLKDQKFKFRRSVIRQVGNGTDTTKIASTISSRLLIKRGGVDFAPLKNIKRRAADSVLEYRTRIKNERAQRDSNGVSSNIGRQIANPDDADGNGVPDGDETDRQVADEANRQVDEAKSAGSQGAKGSNTLKSLKAGLGKSAGPVVVVGALCTIKTFGNEAEALQYQNIVLPMMRIGFRVISTGNQVMKGQDVNMDELGALAEDLNEPDEDGRGPDKGSTWAAARSIQAELGQAQTGPDIPIEAKPSRVGQKPAVFEAVDSIKGLGGVCGIYSAIGGLPIIKQASSVVSASFIAAANLALRPFGTSVEGVIGSALSMAAGRAVDPYAQGADLGNIANYGARLAANDQALAMGGRELSAQEASMLDALRDQKYAYEHNNMSVVKRLFDYRSSDSAIGKIIDKIPSYPEQIPEKVADLPNTAIGSLSNIFSLVSPQARAATSYDYGFPEYGFSAAEQSDERFENPFENAAVIEPRLAELNERYSECFNMQVVPVEEGNNDLNLENGSAVRYDKIPDKCKSVNDEDLLRYRFYLADAVTAHSLACYEGEEASCLQVGFSSGSSGDTSETTTTADVTIDTGALNQDSSRVACAPETRNLGVYTGYTGGQPVRIRLCAVPNLPCSNAECNGGYGIRGANGQSIVNSRVSGAVYAMVQAARADGVNLTATSTFRTIEHQRDLCPCDGVRVARPGYSNHQMGLAIDFGGLPSSRGPVPGNPVWDWLSNNASKFGYINYENEAWHWSPTGH